MNKSYLLFLAFTTNCFVMHAQVDPSQPKSTETVMDEIVITTQLEPQTLKRSINNVRIITKEDIQNLAAVNLGDVLNQYINITVTPSSSSGRTTVSMFGLDASYFKILIDNVPLVNEGGLGNNTDLSQINLNDIEQIEIIEGSMGVTHGANAVSGILNIITKKSSKNKWGVNLSTQEESVGKEFKFFKEGRYIQNIKIDHNINKNWFATVGISNNTFQGFKGNKHGEYYTINDGNRGYSWLPKNQWSGNALVNYTSENLRVFYKFELLDEKIKFFDNAVQSGFSDETGSYKYGNDERYFNNRVYNHINATGRLFDKVNFNISASYQMQKREQETFRYNITEGSESRNIKQKDQSMDVIYSTGTFNNFINSDFFKLQLGYEVINNKGFAVVDEEKNLKKDVNKTLNNYDVFAVSEMNFSERFSLRPGFRYSMQSMFENQYAYSLGGRYLLVRDYEVRASIGRSFRTPDFNELYTRQIFDGHYFIGNEDLLPEKSASFDASLRKTTRFSQNNSAILSNNIILSHNIITDRITSALIGNEGGTPIYKNINVSKYKSINLSTTNQFKVDNWDFNLGMSFTWISQLIDNAQYKTSDDYLFNYNINAKVGYFEPKIKTTFSLYYKFIGKTPLWTVGKDEYVISNFDPYSWLDASIRKSFFKDAFDVSIGARNILNVTDVNRTNTNNGAGHAESSQIMLGYGRSYFVKLSYQFNFK